MTIGIDFDQIFAELKRVMRELQQLPAASEVAVSEGGSSKATQDFRTAVDLAARSLGAATDKTIQALNETHDTIRDVILQMAETDASLADEANAILQVLDSAASQSADDDSVKADY